MTGRAVALVLTHAGAACREAAARLFPDVAPEVLSRAELRPSAPFDGRLFDLLGAQPCGATVGLVVPVVAGGGEDEQAGSRLAPGALLEPGDLVSIADHVGLEARGPLTGRWPAGVPRDFPGTTGIYQPAIVRPPGGARVYSSGVVAAGVADARHLSRYEARAVREGGWPVLSDSLVPAAVAAAYYGLKLAACGCVQAPTDERE